LGIKDIGGGGREFNCDVTTISSRSIILHFTEKNMKFLILLSMYRMNKIFSM
jgi:hypothetical protein